MDFRKLYDTYYEPLAMFADRYLSDTDEAIDVVQNFFVYIYQNAEVLENVRDVKAFFYQSVKNRCLNVIKHRHIEEQYNAEVLNVQHEEYDDIYRQIEYSELELQVTKIINQLSEGCRKVFIMSRVDGMTNDEIAESLNISKRTVETQISNALKKLKSYRHLLSWLVVSALLLVACESDSLLQPNYTQHLVFNCFAQSDGTVTIDFYPTDSYAGSGATLEGDGFYTFVVNDTVRQRGKVSGRVTFDAGQISGNSVVEASVQYGDDVYRGSTVMPETPVMYGCSLRGPNVRAAVYTAAKEELDKHSYYQFLTLSGDSVLRCNYSDAVFAAAQINLTSNNTAVGLFSSEHLGGNRRVINYTITDTLQQNQPVTIRLNALSESYYFYLLSMIKQSNFLLLPVFSQESLYSNTTTGYGVVAAVNSYEFVVTE